MELGCESSTLFLNIVYYHIKCKNKLLRYYKKIFRFVLLSFLFDKKMKIEYYLPN